jgi:AraC-like DNA-binding protein
MAMPTSSFQSVRAALSVCRLTTGPGFAVDDVQCGSARGGWSDPEELDGYALVLTRAGCFTRRANGSEVFVDSALAYFRLPGEEQQIAHPVGHGDCCTSIALEPGLLASMWGGALDGLPARVFATPQLDRAHRRLLARCRSGAAADEAHELICAITVVGLAQRDVRRTESGRPTTARARRRLVAESRALLAQNPKLTLSELARHLSVSPHHLSRVFAAATGMPVTTYRNRLRVQAALERIAAGEHSLARLAAELGFADHAHMTRTIREHTGVVPSAHRAGAVSPPRAALERAGRFEHVRSSERALQMRGLGDGAGSVLAGGSLAGA